MNINNAMNINNDRILCDAQRKAFEYKNAVINNIDDLLRDIDELSGASAKTDKKLRHENRTARRKYRKESRGMFALIAGIVAMVTFTATICACNNIAPATSTGVIKNGEIYDDDGSIFYMPDEYHFADGTRVNITYNTYGTIDRTDDKVRTLSVQ